MNKSAYLSEKDHEQMIHVKITIKQIKDIRYDDQSLSLIEAAKIPKNWCEENISGIWSTQGVTNYYFEEESDAMAFKLRWIE